MRSTRFNGIVFAFGEFFNTRRGVVLEIFLAASVRNAGGGRRRADDDTMPRQRCIAGGAGLESVV